MLPAKQPIRDLTRNRGGGCASFPDWKLRHGVGGSGQLARAPCPRPAPKWGRACRSPLQLSAGPPRPKPEFQGGAKVTFPHGGPVGVGGRAPGTTRAPRWQKFTKGSGGPAAAGATLGVGAPELKEGGTVGRAAWMVEQSQPQPWAHPGCTLRWGARLGDPSRPPARVQCRVPHTPQPDPRLAASWRRHGVRLGWLPRARG